MRFGVYLPTFAWRDLGFEQAARVKAFARKADDLGFDALWVAEHFLEAPGLAPCDYDLAQLERFATAIVGRFERR